MNETAKQPNLLQRAASSLETPHADDPASGLEKLAAGIASGVGVLGFVSFTGGAIAWLRFNAAHLPTDQAVAAVPENELIVIGAAALVAYLLAGGIAVLLTYLIDSQGGPRATLLVASIWGLAGVGYAIFGTDMSAGSVLICTGTAVTLVLLAGGLAIGTKGRFLWVGAGLFFGVLLFGSLTQYLSNKDAPRVQPVAVLRGPNDAGLVGVYVTLTDKRLYIKQVQARGYGPGLYVFSCADVSGLAIGNFQRPGDNGTDAYATGANLLSQLKSARRRANAEAPSARPSTNDGAEPPPAAAPGGAGVC